MNLATTTRALCCSAVQRSSVVPSPRYPGDKTNRGSSPANVITPVHVCVHSEYHTTHGVETSRGGHIQGRGAKQTDAVVDLVKNMVCVVNAPHSSMNTQSATRPNATTATIFSWPSPSAASPLFPDCPASPAPRPSSPPFPPPAAGNAAPGKVVGQGGQIRRRDKAERQNRRKESERRSVKRH